jgi:hypothetical protein
MNLAKRATGRGSRLFGVLVLCGLAAALGSHFFATSAPPLARTVGLVERDPSVANVVGSPASVSLVTTRRLRRDILQALSGQDSVSILSKVKGPKGEASFRLDARNVNGQGWAGTFAIEAPSRSVLKDGQYVTEGEGTVLDGDFAPDGAPRIKKR